MCTEVHGMNLFNVEWGYLISSIRFIVGVYQKSQKHLMLKSQISQSKYMFKVMIFLAVLGDLCGPTNIQTYHP